MCNRPGDQLTVDEFAHAAFMSRVHVFRVLPEVTGASGCDLRIARCREIEKVVYVKRGVPPDNVCSHTNTTGKDASYGRSGYSKDAVLCNSQGRRFLLADDAAGGTVPDVDRSRSRVPEAGHGP